jgi:hypothetical protein
MTRHRWIVITSAAAALGGLSWLAKVAIIVATDGRVVDEGPAAFAYLLGAALMLAGSTAIGVRLAGRQSRPVLSLAVALSPLIFVVSFMLLDGLAKPLVGNLGPTYWRDEAGILVTGLAWLGIGIGMLESVRRSQGDRLDVRETGSPDPASVTTP